MSQRTCRCCGADFEHPAPASLSTKRYCTQCATLPEGIRAVLERHQSELVRLRKELAQLNVSTGQASAEE